MAPSYREATEENRDRETNTLHTTHTSKYRMKVAVAVAVVFINLSK